MLSFLFMITSVVPLFTFLKFGSLFCFKAFSAFCSLHDKLCFGQVIFISAN